MPLKVLIIGAGVAGPALALMLRRSSSGQEQEAYDITVIERSPELRTAGQQIDIRDHGIPIMRSLGLMPELDKVRVNEKGLSFVDSRGRSKASFGTADTRSESDENHNNPKRKQRQAGVSEWEILRGDLVRVLYQASLGKDVTTPAVESRVPGLNYEFNKTVTKMEEASNQVTVTFSDETTDTYDLVVAADGQSSRTRRTMFATEKDRQATTTSSPFLESRDLFLAYYSIPRSMVLKATPAPYGERQQQQPPSPPSSSPPSPSPEKKEEKEKEDLLISKIYHAPNCRAISIRHGQRAHVPESEARTQVYLAVLVDSSSNDQENNWRSRAKLRSVLSLPLKEQKRFWAEHFRDAGWVTGDMVTPLLEDAEEGRQEEDLIVNDFYTQEIGQVKMPNGGKWVTRLLDDEGQQRKEEEEGEKEEEKEKLGRVVLLGDAGYTPSPITGQGTTASLTGAYVLAGELEKWRKGEGEGEGKKENLGRALKGYEDTIRPFVKIFQDLPPGVPRLVYFESTWGIKVLHGVLGVVGALKLPQILNMVLPESKGGKVLPEYKDLRLGSGSGMASQTV